LSQVGRGSLPMLWSMEAGQARGFVLTVVLEDPELTDHHIDRIVRDLSHMTAVRGLNPGAGAGDRTASIHCFVLERTEHDAICYAIQRVRTAALGRSAHDHLGRRDGPRDRPRHRMSGRHTATA
jgi:hypothetical protein